MRYVDISPKKGIADNNTYYCNTNIIIYTIIIITTIITTNIITTNIVTISIYIPPKKDVAALRKRPATRWSNSNIYTYIYVFMCVCMYMCI